MQRDGDRARGARGRAFVGSARGGGAWVAGCEGEEKKTRPCRVEGARGEERRGAADMKTKRSKNELGEKEGVKHGGEISFAARRTSSS
jgi:hypothetical protein